MTTHHDDGLDRDRLEALTRATVIDRNGDKVGAVGQLFLDDTTGQPSWVAVRTAMFGGRETFIPLRDAEQVGDDLRVPYEKNFIKDAPNLDADEHLSPQQEQELYRYYSQDDRQGEPAPVAGMDRDHDGDVDRRDRIDQRQDVPTHTVASDAPEAGTHGQ